MREDLIKKQPKLSQSGERQEQESTGKTTAVQSYTANTGELYGVSEAGGSWQPEEDDWERQLSRQHVRREDGRQSAWL